MKTGNYKIIFEVHFLYIGQVVTGKLKKQTRRMPATTKNYNELTRWLRKGKITELNENTRECID